MGSSQDAGTGCDGIRFRRKRVGKVGGARVFFDGDAACQVTTWKSTDSKEVWGVLLRCAAAPPCSIKGDGVHVAGGGKRDNVSSLMAQGGYQFDFYEAQELEDQEIFTYLHLSNRTTTIGEEMSSQTNGSKGIYDYVICGYTLKRDASLVLY